MLQEFCQNDVDIEEFMKFKESAVLMEHIANLLSPKRIDRQFVSLCKGFKKYFSRNEIAKFVIWNGSMLQGYTASKIADHFGISKLFFETGNFPNKLFVDPEGVNAASNLTDKDLSICSNYNEDKLNNFLTGHKRIKEEMHLVPQAKKGKQLNYFTIWDSLYNLFAQHPILENDYTLFGKLKRMKFANKFSIDYYNTQYGNTDYILFPLQVSIDSQLIRNSDLTTQESIDYALNVAQENNLALLIKPHPAEKNKNIVTYICDLKKQHNNIYLTNQNTYQLIKHCKKLITINSTVGIEGLMYYKHVEVLGKALYKRYCEPDLSKPINKDIVNRFLYNYLFNILQQGSVYGRGKLTINLES
ncbi:hypothetical protein ES705_47564 [subsurface metagenome]